MSQNKELQKDEEFVLKLANVILPKMPSQMSNGCHNASVIILNDIKDRVDEILRRLKPE
jgi:hypothetical protein